ncbi:DUF302 domain-containing protein [Thiobacillus denitrificans]|uniref:DUF302 domain-containing protein n=1 Tax=Thiobacillus denitrificans TaxID=36861 RepID=A0A106BLJ9_THIDE|nr:DUF302 domain-containing protein [Thiobacillus denitrificans]KVW94702.1 hypothetical protein ABW22_11730 [Thiobacillus denitrificans]
MKKLLAVCAMLCLPFSAQAVESYTVLFKTQGSFQEVRDLLQFSIEGKGLKITNTNKIAEMLERTGMDIGETRQVYENAEQFEFCSATISRHMMEADPHSIVMCPYSVVVYTIPNDKTVYLAYRKPAATKNPALKKTLVELEKLLTDIIKDAM